MATVIYDGNAVIPGPLPTVSRETQTADDGTPVGALYTITLRGKIIPWKGSPDSAGSFWTASGYPPDETKTSDQMMGAILRKQEALTRLFSDQGKTLELSPPDGAAPRTCNPRLKSIAFDEGPWFVDCGYTVTLEADAVDGLAPYDAGDAATYKISRAGEDWSVETLNEKLKTYRLTHTVSATGKRFFGADGSLSQAPWENARDYVLGAVGLGLKPDRLAAPGVLDATNLQAFDYLRTQQVGELAGTFGVTETWLCYDANGGPAAYEETTVNVRRSVVENRTVVTIEGTISGLQVSDNSTYGILSTRYANASAKWALVEPALLTRAQTTSGVTLNPTPMSRTTGYNEVGGVVTYSAEYDTRPTATTSGALSEIVTVQGNYPSDVFAVLAVPGRAAGPVLQAMATIKERKLTVTVEVQMPPASVTSTPARPDVTRLVLDNRPNATTVFVEDDTDSWAPYSGRYTRTTAFVWQ